MAMPHRDEDTVDFLADTGGSELLFNAKSVALAFQFGATTHPGLVRSNNEDHFAVIGRRRTNEFLLTNLPSGDLPLADDRDYALVVADGMGGRDFGEFASRMALKRMLELMAHAASWVMKFTDVDALQVRKRVDAYAQEVQRTLRDCAAMNPSLAGMGTTWTSAHLMSTDALIAHIGDSRAYLLHEGELHQLTRDETMAQALIDSGLANEDVGRFRHLLLNSLGGDKDDVVAQIHYVEIAPGDQLLLCTDGLSDMVRDDEIAASLRQAANPQAACDALVNLALDGGGEDNITVVLARASQDAADDNASASGTP